uniref:Uncharacterized protein n=1 Tax=Arundo donax TaxID=35708 RepID=A0A0A9AZ35_ARUDO
MGGRCSVELFYASQVLKLCLQILVTSAKSLFR